MWKKFNNRVGNVLSVVPRLVGAGLVTIKDSLITLLNTAKEGGDILMKTGQDIWDVLRNPYAQNNGYTWDKRIVKGMVSPFVAVGTGIEGAVRSVLSPTRNGVCNAVKTLWNSAKNIGRPLWRIFSTKHSLDYNHSQLEPNKHNPYNRIPTKFKTGKWKRAA
jgi:phage-related protein